MRIATLTIGATLALTPIAASAQNTAAEIYSYKAPSGMFSEGTTAWQNYKFRMEDQERTARLNAELKAGEDVSTGSIGSSSSSNMDSYPRPGERSRSPRRVTSH